MKDFDYVKFHYNDYYQVSVSYFPQISEFHISIFSFQSLDGGEERVKYSFRRANFESTALIFLTYELDRHF